MPLGAWRERVNGGVEEVVPLRKGTFSRRVPGRGRKNPASPPSCPSRGDLNHREIKSDISAITRSPEMFNSMNIARECHD